MNSIPTPINPLSAGDKLFKAGLAKLRMSREVPKLREELENRKGIPCAGKSPLTDRDLMDIVKARREDERNRKPKQIKPVPPFKRNPKHSKTEYERQLKNQETAINNMTVKDWLKNKDDFRNNRQKHDKFAAQKRKEYREKIKQEKINEYKRNNGREKDLDQKAENYANSYLKGKSALHNPDGIAGGRADQISGMGDSRVNSSIGSQWQHGRADAIENQIKQQYGIPPKTVDDIPATDMMNIKLI
ncbi:polymorphic toxin type 15 domain-containing protein [Treponema pedis]|uniref:polymorphic toxin type 15 domain-containing protein n=1 Tax=Treponema pedis TaxID=409322 RepID=UPI00178C7A9E|nr:polymorphic toxin type 15 domain-containing protein [Treponema pedis]